MSDDAAHMPIRDLRLQPEKKRVEINLGYACNNRCIFCSEIPQRRKEVSSEEGGQPTTDRILATLMRLRKRGFRHLTFLGGEPTIRRDFLTLVRAAKKLGYRTVLLTTNGRRLADGAYAEALFEAGVNRLYLSLHGHDAQIHDAAVQAPGAFGQTTRAMENLRAAGLPFSLSSVIHRGNAASLPELLEFEISQKPLRIFWAFVRPTGGARENFEEIVPTYTELDAPLRAALSIAGTSGVPLTVAHVPLCRMTGLEKHVDELYWSDAVIEREVERYAGPADGRKEGGATTVTKGHYKLKHIRCAECRYASLCEGVHSEYAKRRGFSEFIPVKGEAVTSPAGLRDERMLEEEDGQVPR